MSDEKYICSDCKRVLTPEEVEYYGNTCESYEMISYDKLLKRMSRAGEPRLDIPQIPEICDKLKSGAIVLNQAIYWMQMHAQRQ